MRRAHQSLAREVAIGRIAAENVNHRRRQTALVWVFLLRPLPELFQQRSRPWMLFDLGLDLIDFRAVQEQVRMLGFCLGSRQTGSRKPDSSQNQGFAVKVLSHSADPP